MTQQRFAAKTEVPVDRTQGEIKTMLRASGADRIAIFESAERSAVGFQIATGMYRVTIPHPKAKTIKDRQQAERSSWRLLHLLIKSKLEAVRQGVTTVEREFLADRLLHDGRTVSEFYGPQIDEAQRLGHMPKTLMIEGPRS